MLREALYVLAFFLVTALSWFFKNAYPAEVAEKWYYTALALTATYFVFKFVLQALLSKQITDEKLKYSFRKTVSILAWAVFLILFIRIWIKNPQALLVAYGLVGAGVAIALQDVFKNFVGGITIFLNGMYRVGDRIEVNGEFGDVIDIGLMYTTVLEMREWVQGDQATGRICVIPNGVVLGSVVNNYTRDHSFIWDEITIPITYDSDWRAAKERILEIVSKETKRHAEQAEKEIARIKQQFYLSKRDVQPNVFLTMTDNWITFSVRYVTLARERRLVHTRLTQAILEELQKMKNVTIASQTIDIVRFPDVKVKRHG